MQTLEARGVEIAWRERGEGTSVLLVHETAADASVWDAVVEALAGESRAISYDRRGWGQSGAPVDYRRTTIEEQSEDAAALIETLEAAPALVIGAGVGGMVGLDLLLRRPELVAGTVLIEPPILQLHPMGTEALSDDRRRLEVATAAGEDVIGLYLSGGLPTLGAGVSRLPDELRASARQRPTSLIAEIGIPAGWQTRLARLATAARPSAIVTTRSTPPLLREAATALTERLAGGSAHEVDSGAEAPHLGAAEEVATLALELR